MPLTPRRPKSPPSRPHAIEPCPAGVVPLDDAVYVGSPEHKAYVNPVNGEIPAPRPRDASLCERFPEGEWCVFTSMLREAIRAGCASDWDASGRPKYVWGWYKGRLFQARRRSEPSGNLYKGWWIEEWERPRDREGRLERLRARLEQRRV